MSDLIDKAWKVVNSCQTATQAKAALKYLELLANQHPEVDVLPLVKEIRTLFEFK
jgi:hypothetical protein